MSPIANGLTPALPGNMGPNAAEGVRSAEQMNTLGTEFESVFLSMMLKEMRQSLDEGFFGGDSSDSFGGMVDLFIGKHLAQSNPIGIADLMLQQYSKEPTTDDKEPQGITIKA